jgi:transglutaminase-like putative cysteine protease
MARAWPITVQTGGVPHHHPSPAARHVRGLIAFDVADDGATIVAQVAPARSAGTTSAEELVVRRDGEPFEGIVTEVAGDHGGRLHVLRAEPGRLDVTYTATVTPHPPGEVERGPADAIDLEALTYLRQSRYCPSDELLGFAQGELGQLAADDDRAAAVASWVFEHLAYEPGSSGPLDTAIDTLVGRRGVCRDFAHLTIAFCRALEIPARLVAVYAPGLSPMDFHAVVEVRVAGRWQVLDPTRLAPRTSLVRIGTGRDAADTAFVTVLAGHAELVTAEVTAVIDGDLPADDHRAVVALA